MSLQIYNSLFDQKEPFNPVHEGQASLYVCGPTVYSDSHLGHAKAYVSFDVILRYLRFCGLKTLYVQNIVGSSRVDLQACKLEYSIVSPK